MNKIFKKIYSVIDNLIVTPISRFLYFIKKKSNKSFGWVDKLLNKKRFLLYLSLAFAVIFFLLIDSNAINIEQSQAEVIRNVPVKVKYNEEAYVVEGVPETVDITISGDKYHIYLARQLGEYEVELDLTEYSASDSPYKVEFDYTKSIDNLTYKLDPSYASVVIRNKVSDIASITYDLLNVDELDPELSVKSVVLDKNEVVIKGSEAALAEVATVKALVDLDNSSLTASGTYTISDVKLVAYDNLGKILSNVEIVPNNINASVTLDSYSKSLPISVRTTGTLIPGKAIAAIQINEKSAYSIDVFGEKTEIENLIDVPVTVDIDGLGKNSAQTYNVSISKPSGVRHMSEDSVVVSVTFGDEEQKTVDIGSQISVKNLSSDYSANIVSVNSTTVQVKGVSSVINSIDEKSINAYVDLSGLEEGEHEVEVKIDNTNPLVNYVVSSTIKIVITKK